MLDRLLHSSNVSSMLSNTVTRSPGLYHRHEVDTELIKRAGKVVVDYRAGAAVCLP